MSNEIEIKILNLLDENSDQSIADANKNLRALLNNSANSKSKKGISNLSALDLITTKILQDEEIANKSINVLKEILTFYNRKWNILKPEVTPDLSTLNGERAKLISKMYTFLLSNTDFSDIPQNFSSEYYKMLFKASESNSIYENESLYNNDLEDILKSTSNMAVLEKIGNSDFIYNHTEEYRKLIEDIVIDGLKKDTNNKFSGRDDISTILIQYLGTYHIDAASVSRYNQLLDSQDIDVQVDVAQTRQQYF